MPLGDRTGPVGAGPMTGRGAGYCAGYDVPGYMNPAAGRGAFGRGRGLGRGGGGRGFRNRYYATGQTGWARAAGGLPTQVGPSAAVPQSSPAQEKEYLNQQTKVLKEELKATEKRLGELEKDSGK
ncbi:MAG: DUF5320 domain-containing protein [Elusimicrobia bacterium]|jgi:hypothetical protein|nr:DUF5320 domain-containing protein [Elusimicrobiota bacterium]